MIRIFIGLLLAWVTCPFIVIGAIYACIQFMFNLGYEAVQEHIIGRKF